jgi:hypothetical protein
LVSISSDSIAAQRGTRKQTLRVSQHYSIPCITPTPVMQGMAQKRFADLFVTGCGITLNQGPQ